MEIVQATEKPTVDYGHRWADEDEQGYGICGRCGARENTPYSASPCRGHSISGKHSGGLKPVNLEPVLAFIHTQTDLGPQHWYEVVYHDDDGWRSYSGSDTFEDGEIVIRWKYCDGALWNSNAQHPEHFTPTESEDE